MTFNDNEWQSPTALAEWHLIAILMTLFLSLSSRRLRCYSLSLRADSPNATLYCTILPPFSVAYYPPYKVDDKINAYRNMVMRYRLY